MRYEKGKTYTFTNKQFNIGRDGNNRLMFIVPDPASAGEYRILAFNYQNNNIPERITCIFNGTRFEQDPLSAAMTLYKPGDIVSFYANSDVRMGKCTLRDEKNDVTYKNLKVGRAKFNRFDRIKCRIDEITPDNLAITPLLESDDEKNNRFSADSLKAMPEGRYLRGGNVLDKLLADRHYIGARKELEADDTRWVVTFLEETLAWAVELIRVRKLTKDYVLPGIESMAVALIERTDYVSIQPNGQQAAIQERLENVASNAADYRRVYNLLQCHEADSMMHTILGSLKKSSRFYQPEEKVRLLGAMITLEAVDVRRYMEEVLDILTEHHANHTFMSYFKEGMQRILARFITDREEHISDTDRNSIRLLVRALATEQLLAAGTVDRERERRRGLLYACAAILINNCENDLPAKAIQCFAGLVSAGPEYSWADLKDIQRLCYAYLTQPFKKTDLVTATASAEFGGCVIEVSPEYLTVASRPDIGHLKRTLAYPLAPGITIDFMTEDRISGLNPNTSLENPILQRNAFRELVHLLRSNTAAALPVNRQDLRLDVGDRVNIRVTSRRDNGFYDCEIVDSAFTGHGTLGERDIVAYDTNSRIDDFRRDGLPLTFDAVVKGILPDGTYQFTIRSSMNSYGHQQATYDFDSDAEVTCVVTGVYKPGRGYYALSENGYPMVVWLPADADYELHRNDMVVAHITSVNSENDNLFVKGEYIDFIDPADENFNPENILTVDSIYRSALQGMANGVYEGEEDPGDGKPLAELRKTELESVDIHWILRLMNRMAFIGEQKIGRRYSMMAMCRIIAGIAGMVETERHYGIQESVFEELGNFAATARIDMTRKQAIQAEAAKLSEKDETMSNLLELLNVLAGLDRPEGFTTGNYTPNSVLSKTSRMVTAYNQLQGLSLNTARREIMKGIYDLLQLPQPQTIDVECLKVQEDERNEFKTSLIYPADNNMHADEFKQGRVIMEVIDGMLNHKGGTIYLGVNNQGVPSGLDNDFRFLNSGSDRYDLRDIEDKFSLHFHYYLRNQIGMTYDGHTITDYVKLGYDTLAGKITARVTVEAFPGVVRMRDGKVFQRQDSSTIALRPAEQTALAQRRATVASE